MRHANLRRRSLGPVRHGRPVETIERRLLLAAHVGGSGTSYATIQAAVNAAPSGGTVTVDAGTYAEQVTVTKPLTIDGAQAGVDARGSARVNGSATTESVVTGAASGSTVTSAFHVLANDVTIDGFTVKGETSQDDQLGAGIVIGPGRSGAHVTDDVVEDNVSGLFLANASPTDAALIQHDYFASNNNNGDNGGRGIYTDGTISGGDLTNVTIDGNTFYNNRGGSGTTGLEAGIALEAGNEGEQSDVRVTNNTFAANGKATLFFNTTDVLIEGNTVTGTLDHWSGSLRGSNEGGRLPIPLTAEAVPVGHEPLRGDAGQLLEAVQVLERVGEADERPGFEERPQAQLDPGGVPQRLVPGGPLPQFGRDRVLLGVLAAEAVDGRVARLVDVLDEVADGVRVDGVAELRLGRDLVAVGDGDEPHVVAEPGEVRPLAVVPGAGGPHPGADPALDLGVGPVADDDLAAEPQPGVQVPGLPVAVGGLVQVHEVHVDLGPRQVAVELRVQVQDRLGQGRQPADPHLGRRERVHPQDDAAAGGRRRRLQAERADLLRPRDDRLEHDRGRELARCVQPGHHLLRVRRHLFQRGLAVQVLAAGHVPELDRFQVLHKG